MPATTNPTTGSNISTWCDWLANKATETTLYVVVGATLGLSLASIVNSVSNSGDPDERLKNYVMVFGLVVPAVKAGIDATGYLVDRIGDCLFGSKVESTTNIDTKTPKPGN